MRNPWGPGNMPTWSLYHPIWSTVRYLGPQNFPLRMTWLFFPARVGPFPGSFLPRKVHCQYLGPRSRHVKAVCNQCLQSWVLHTHMHEALTVLELEVGREEGWLNIRYQRLSLVPYHFSTELKLEFRIWIWLFKLSWRIIGKCRN